MTHPLTDPDCPQSVRDQINGGVTQEAREIAATYWQERGFEALPNDILAGTADDGSSVQIAQRALTTAQAKRKQLEADLRQIAELSGDMVIGVAQDIARAALNPEGASND